MRSSLHELLLLLIIFDSAFDLCPRVSLCRNIYFKMNLSQISLGKKFSHRKKTTISYEKKLTCSGHFSMHDFSM